MLKVAQEASKPEWKAQGIEVLPDSWTEKDSGKQHEDVYLRAKSRDVMEKFFTGLTGDLAVPPDHEIGFEELSTRAEDGAATPDCPWRTHYMHRRAALTGEYLSNADQNWDQQTGCPEVAIELRPPGRDDLSERPTGDNIGRKMAIILDDKVNSAPVIEAASAAARAASRMGGFAIRSQLQQEAKDLVAVLRTGALPAPLKRRSRPQVGPTLGRDAVDKAKTSMLHWRRAVILFMLIYYRFSGLDCRLSR